MAPRNLPWSRDELIVTLDFYLQHSPRIPEKNTVEISQLSEFLTRLQKKIGGDVSETFRNTNGVYMKLMNFRRFDPDFEGKGLERGNKDEGVVWNLYSSKRNELRKVSDAIRDLVSSDTPLPPKEVMFDDEEECNEGQVLTRTHRVRERNTRIIKRKKDQVLQQKGTLSCEVCGFDFLKVYGTHGGGFIECHHIRPVSEMKDEDKTKLSDLSLVCSNCHRMIHRKRSWLSIDELQGLISG